MTAERRGDDRRQDGGGEVLSKGERLKIGWQVISWFLGICLAGFLGYQAHQNEVTTASVNVSERVTVLETKSQNVDTRLDNIDRKLDRIFDLLLEQKAAR